MTTSGPARLLRNPRDPQVATFLELFFDLVFIFAITRLSEGLIRDLRLIDAFETVVLLLAVWWVWTLTAWLTNVFDPRRPQIQLLVIAIMLGTLVMSAALPEAFHSTGLFFASAYVAIHIGRTLFLLLALRGHELQGGAVRVLFWFGTSAVPWIAGAFVHSGWRGLLWTIAVGLDYAAARLDFPTPWLGRARTLQWTVAGEHLAERYRQFMIIALGNSILVAGSTFDGKLHDTDRAVAFMVSFATTVLLWRIYFYRAGELLSDAIAAARNPAGLARSASYTHLLMIAGTIVVAVGYQLVIAHPFARTQPAWIAVILGGPALFLAGRARFEYTVFAHVSWSRRIGLLILAAMAPFMILISPLMVAGSTALVLGGIAASNVAAWRLYPREPTPPSL